MLRKILAFGFTALGVVWTLLTYFATATTLGPDLYDFWSKNMSGDPWLPWALLSLGLASLAWIYWPAYRFLFAKESSVTASKKHLDQSINIGTMTGGSVSPVYNNQFNTIVAPGRTELSSLGLNQLAATLAGRRVMVEIIGDHKCQNIGERTIQQLSQRGVQVESVSNIGTQSPPPSEPYSVQYAGDKALLIISPATLP